MACWEHRCSLPSSPIDCPAPARFTLKQSLQFVVPVYPGDEITIKVVLVRMRRQRGIATLKTTCSNQHGDLVIDGEATVLVRDALTRAAVPRSSKTKE